MGAKPLSRFQRFALDSPRPLAMPIATYPGIKLTRGTLRDVVTNAQAQFDAQAALHQRYRGPIMMSAMDLSAEAEAFGCQVELSEREIPTVTGRLITTLDQARTLAVPVVGEKRTRVFLETVRLLRAFSKDVFVFGESIGPFSLAARLVGVSEALELTLTEPELLHVLLEKSTRFLMSYVEAFVQSGADGLIMAEPAAGLLSPRGLVEFSSAYVKRIAQTLRSDDFCVILHNCGAKLVHLPAILSCGLSSFHFGSPMDLVAALQQADPDLLICGNLDPTAVFCQLSPGEIAVRCSTLLDTTRTHRNYVLSSGCDLPANTPLESLDAFYESSARK